MNIQAIMKQAQKMQNDVMKSKEEILCCRTKLAQMCSTHLPRAKSDIKNIKKFRLRKSKEEIVPRHNHFNTVLTF